MTLTLDLATRIVDATLGEARSRHARPLGVIVLDAGGHAIVFKREDGASLFRFDIAHAKAMGSLGMGADSATRRRSRQRAFTPPRPRPQASRLCAGGVLVLDASGAVLGAVGVSGDTADVDEACAHAGIVAAGLNHGGAQ
jgi:uncharacterized protein GlcG (DUF336 family)